MTMTTAIEIPYVVLPSGAKHYRPDTNIMPQPCEVCNNFDFVFGPKHEDDAGAWVPVRGRLVHKGCQS